MLTPIAPLKYKLNSNSFFIKRDDLIPFSFGGNKVRIAEKYFNDMMNNGYDCIISYGSVQSNLNRVIANVSASKGIPCFIVSPVEEEEEVGETFNEKIIQLTNANVVYCNKHEVSETIQRLINQCKTKGLSPYYIYGDKYGKGNEKTAVEAYMECFEEIKQFERTKNVRFDYIFLASGTGATQSGLICGSLLSNDYVKNIIGISIAREKKKGLSAIKNYISSFDGSFINNTEINFDDNYILEGYSSFNQEISDVINKVFIHEGVPLDTTYTGKAFWGMTKYIEKYGINNKNILFLHTGGTPLFFDDMK